MLQEHPRIRLGIYLTALALNAVALVVRVYDPALGDGLQQAGGVLGVAALATAASNVKTTNAG